MLTNSFTEIQGPHRRPPSTKTHGLPGWCCPRQPGKPISPRFILYNMLIRLQIADKDDMWVSKQEWQEQGARALAKLGPR